MEHFVVGIHPRGHDVSAAILNSDGTIVHVAEEERYSRQKGSTGLLTLDRLLEVFDEADVSVEDVRRVAVAGIPGLVARRGRHGLTVESQSESAALVDELSARLPNVQFVNFVRHHVAHAASAAWSAPFERALVITADGMGEVDTLTISAFVDFQLDMIERREFPHSVGWVYRRLCNLVGIKGIEREGKFMGLAAHGRARFVEQLRAHVMSTEGDGMPLLVEALLVAGRAGHEQKYLADVLGLRNDAPVLSVPDDPLGFQVAADIAASAQNLLGQIIGELIGSRCNRLQMRSVAAAGGVFMNSVLNGELARSPSLDRYFAQPLAADNGLALGAALAVLAPRRVDLLPDLYLGSDTGRPTARRVSARFPSLIVERPRLLAQRVAQLVNSGEPVALCRGRSEIGSRALGHRSVLGSAARVDTGPTINRRLKRREPWRPFAVTLLEEASMTLFGAPLRTPFMTEVHELVRPDLVPAVAHVDGTTRPQTVSRRDGDPFLVELLDCVAGETGVAALLNTSLNRNGEPLVRTWLDALDLFDDSDLTHLVIDDLLITKR